jgi:transposase-like protein
MSKLKQYTAEFKMKVALEAAKGIEGVNDIAGKYQIHSKQVTEWKRRLIANAELIFERRPQEEDAANKREESLLRKVGQLSMEVDWLKKKLEDSPHQ